MAEAKKKCFVIMPISGSSPEHTESYWTEHFKNFLTPLIEENHALEAFRSKAVRGDLLRQIVTDLVLSPIVVADLTDQNPNVYWELGVRQSFKHGTITIAEFGTHLPFDIIAKGTLFYYPSDHLKMAEFQKSFRVAIADCLDHSERSDSQVLDILGGRGSLFEIFRRDEAMRRVESLRSETAHNLAVARAALRHAQQNQEERKKPVAERNAKIPTSRFSVAAVELLVTNRYLDEENSFYQTAEHYILELNRLQGQLSTWDFSDNADRTELWILKYEVDLPKQIEEFLQKVDAARTKSHNRP